MRKSDEGTYRCSASNDAGEGDQVVNIYVREQRVQPTPPSREREVVTVTPSQHEGAPGEEIILRCSANPRGQVTWSKVGSVELPRSAQASDDELVIRYATVDDSGRYSCTVYFPSGVTRVAHSDVVIGARSNEVAATIRPLEKKYTVVQSQDFEITCEVSGSPYPEVTWSYVSYSMIFFLSVFTQLNFYRVMENLSRM